LQQCKSAYLLLPLITLAIPIRRFVSRAEKALFCAACRVPGFVASMLWMLTLRLTYFDDRAYRTWSGVVHPAEQLQLVLHAPFTFLVTLGRTVFATPFAPRLLLDLLGTFGPPVMISAFWLPVVGMGTAGLFLLDNGKGEIDNLPTVRVLSVLIGSLTLLLILLLLYLQWTRYGAPVVDGFNARYLFPLAPLLLLSFPVPRLLAARSVNYLLIILACVTCWATVSTTYLTYWR